MEQAADAVTVVKEPDVGLVVLDADLAVVSMNAAALALAGFESLPDDCTIFDPRFDVADAAGRRLAHDELPAVRALYTGRCVEQVVAITCGDGRRRLLDVTAMPFGGATGSGVAIMVRDGTPYAGLRERIAALEELNVALAEFAGRASHDLKSPLTAINGMTETLRLHWRDLDDSVRDELLSRVANATERASRLVSDLLDESRRPRVAEHSGIEPRAVVDAVLASSPLTAGEVTIVGEWPRIVVSHADLTTVVANLVDNAHHYGRDADGVLRVTIEGRVDRDRFELVFGDRGAGLGSDAARLFEPFYRGPASARANPASTGLGLALVRRVAERWGGAVTAGVAPGGGAEFRIVLPLAR